MEKRVDSTIISVFVNTAADQMTWMCFILVLR